MKKFAFLTAASVIAAAGSAFAQDFSVNLGNVAVDSAGISIDLNGAGIGAGSYTYFEVSADWVAGGGGPWSSEAIWAFTDAAFTPGVDDPALFTFYADPGSSPDSAGNGDSVTLNWSGLFDIDYSGGNSLFFNALQTFGGSDAIWNNLQIDLFFNQPDNIYQPGAPAGNAPSSIHLGVLGDESTDFDINTLSEDFDTEIGLYDQAGNLIGSNDDAGPLQSQILTGDLGFTGLGAGVYYVAVSEFDTLFGESGFDVTGGFEELEFQDLTLTINGVDYEGGSAGFDSQVQWYSFEVVPTPGAGALFAIAGLAAARRRRA